MSKNKKVRSDSKIGAFVLGTSIGVAAGMLLANKPGSELREDITEVAEQLREKAVDIIENKEEYIETIREAVDKAVKKAKQLYNEVDHDKLKTAVSVFKSKYQKKRKQSERIEANRRKSKK